MGFRATLVGGETVNRALERREQALAGRSALARRAWKRVGMLALSAVDSDFKVLSTGRALRGTQWRKPSFVTALLRAKGPKTQKMTTMADVERRRETLPILVDKGLLRNSFAPAARGSVCAVRATSVEVGTALKKAGPLATGGRVTFHYTAATERRLMGNVRRVLPGPKPSRTSGRRRSRAKKNWNRDYFIMRACLKKMDGKSYKVPARPLILAQPASRLARWAKVFVDTIISQ